MPTERDVPAPLPKRYRMGIRDIKLRTIRIAGGGGGTTAWGARKPFPVFGGMGDVLFTVEHHLGTFENCPKLPSSLVEHRGGEMGRKGSTDRGGGAKFSFF